MAEQPDRQKRFIPAAPSQEQLQPWMAQACQPEDVGALRAVYAGTASEHMQRRAMEFILKQLCGVGRPCFVPGEEGRRATDLALGKQQVGLEIIALCSIKSKPGGEQP